MECRCACAPVCYPSGSHVRELCGLPRLGLGQGLDTHASTNFTYCFSSSSINFFSISSRSRTTSSADSYPIAQHLL